LTRQDDVITGYRYAKRFPRAMDRRGKIAERPSP
jgi:hypothetical protein